MATMLFDRVVPAGKNAYFPFQMSAASLSPVATVYLANDATGADSTVASGVTVDDMGGGLYALKVLSANMTKDNVYYGIVKAGSEVVRIPLWAYDPSNYIADVLGALGASGAGGLFADTTNLYSEIKEIQAELGNIDGPGITYTDITAPATVAASLATIFNKVNGVQTDLDNGTDGLGALKGLIDGVSTLVTTETGNIDTALATIDTEVGNLQTDITSILADTGELQTDWVNGGRLDLLLDRTVAASEAAEDRIGLATDLSSANTLFGKNAKLAEDIGVVDGNVDTIKTAVEHATYGLSAIETKVMTVDTVVDGIASEIGDVSVAFGGGSPPATVAAALKTIYDAQQSAANVWDDAITGSESAGTAGKRLYDLSEDWKNGGRLDLILDEAAADADASRVSAASADSKLGSPVGASVSADIAAVKAVVDTLQVTTNARLVPSVPSEIYSAASAIRVKVSLAVQDGTTGAMEDPDVLGTNGAAQGQALIKLSAAGGAPTMYDAASAGSALATTDAAGLTSWFKMKRDAVGAFSAFIELGAYYAQSVEVSFYCTDSDPQATQTFTSNRYMVVRSPIQAGVGGGAF